MSKIRFRYEKVGKAKYLSHLDLMATMQRAFIRAGIKLRYSEGFNPHPYMSVALPLSVGCESICELMDVGIVDDVIPDIKGISLPEGIVILDAYKPLRKFNEITWIEVSSKMHYNEQITDDILYVLKQRFAGSEIVISKRTKRGFKELDIAPYIKDVEFIFNNCILITAKISAQNPTLNVSDLESVIDVEHKPDFTDTKRIEIYDSNMVLFR